MLSKIIVIIILLFITINSSVIYSIYMRNDYDYPRIITYPYRDLLRDLEKLRELNDPTIDKYIEEIERTIDMGDYSRLLDLLRQLSLHLEQSGYSGEKYEYISILAKLLKALESAGPHGLEINYEKLDPYLRNVFENLGLREYLLTINLETLISLLDKYKGLFPDGASKPATSSSGENPGQLGKLLSPPMGNNPSSNIFSGLQLPGLDLSAIPPVLLPLLASLIATPILLTILLIKYKRSSTAKTISNISYLLTNSVRKIIPGFREFFVDPAILIYNKWYALTKLKGYRRNSYETLREYLQRIKESDLVDIGSRVTDIYEDRVYGSKDVNNNTIRSLEVVLNKLESRGE